MRLTLTGTGPAEGFPVPDCPCAACGRAVRAGTRARPARLVSPTGWTLELDGTVHPGPAPPATGAGAHFLPVGEQITLVRPAGEMPAIVWAPRSGELDDTTLDALADRLEGAAAGLVVLGPKPGPEPVGPTLTAPTAHRNSPEDPAADCARSLARLRRAAVVGPRTRCLLVGFGHHNDRPAWMHAALPFWGAELPVDGSVLELPDQAPEAAPRQPRRLLVLGGSGSGKSDLAEHLLAAAPEVLYLATGPEPGARPEDGEWAERIARHRDRRPSWWQTLETIDVAAPLADRPEPLLLDSVGTWLTGVLDRCGAWQERPGWRERLETDVEQFLTAWRTRRAPLVAVSDEVGWSVVPDSAPVRMFRTELGRLNARLAQASEDVVIVVAGRVLRTEA